MGEDCGGHRGYGPGEQEEEEEGKAGKMDQRTGWGRIQGQVA